MQGKSAKQTGAILNISQRTVEFHLDNIKQKAQCRTKLELLGQVKSTRVS
jgi:DNA-binding CsgD family transcriptional regulator